ncbi:MAG TPA: VOC family protein [Methylomirabilota bacterium]|nr:VOC family protein [Methylomirabilota bacterium]
MPNDDAHAPAPPGQAQPPRGINHVVLNVRDLDVSHRFWTEILGFRCVAELGPIPGRQRPRMRFYSGLDAGGEVTHHDVALAEVPGADGPGGADHEPWSLLPGRTGLNHVAIAWPDRESWLRQIAFLRSKGIPFQRRVNHGMTHSVYISDPDGHGIEVLYELPREVWHGDINAAQDHAELLPTEGDESLVDRTDNPVFGAPAASPVASRS